MKKIIILFIIFIIYINSALALDECKSEMTVDKIPCFVFLPVNTTLTSCIDINVSFFRNATLVDSQLMDFRNPQFCSGNFSETKLATYLIVYSTGDTGSIIVKENEFNIIMLYVIVVITMGILIIVGFKAENEWLLAFAGILSIIIALNLQLNGFPGIDSTFFIGGIFTILWGLGILLMVGPQVEEIEKWKGRLS